MRVEILAIGRLKDEAEAAKAKLVEAGATVTIK